MVEICRVPLVIIKILIYRTPLKFHNYIVYENKRNSTVGWSPLNGLEQIKNLFYKFLDNYSYQELYPFLFRFSFHNLLF